MIYHPHHLHYPPSISLFLPLYLHLCLFLLSSLLLSQRSKHDQSMTPNLISLHLNSSPIPPPPNLSPPPPHSPSSSTSAFTSLLPPCLSPSLRPPFPSTLSLLPFHPPTYPLSSPPYFLSFLPFHPTYSLTSPPYPPPPSPDVSFCPGE